MSPFNTGDCLIEVTAKGRLDRTLVTSESDFVNQ
jgi:hypothetical protein